MNKSLFSLLIVPLVYFIATSMAQPPPLNDWSQYGPYWSSPVNVSDPEIIKAGVYAVSAYDMTIKTATDHLAFIRVVNGTEVELSQYPSAVIWILQMEAKNCSQPGNTDIYVTQVQRNYKRCLWFMWPNCNYYYLTFSGLWKLPAV